ncbi:hypothetical protein V6N11_000023 [Hibiscus sabdariffa]|uniref:Uncharacterized protein n=1 Tax=Hibiscus sabdariffa TaxID=183260 RepID=A0ABR1ZCI2_9ROSI
MAKTRNQARRCPQTSSTSEDLHKRLWRYAAALSLCRLLILFHAVVDDSNKQMPHFIPRTIPILLFHLAPPWLEPETRFVGVQKPHRPAKIYTSVCGGTQQLQVCAASSSSFTPW